MELADQPGNAVFLLAGADDPHLDTVVLEQLRGAHNDVDSMELDERAVEEHPLGGGHDLRSRAEHVVISSYPDDADALPRDLREIGVEIGVARGIGTDSA